MSDKMTRLWRDQAQGALVYRSISDHKDTAVSLPKPCQLLAAQEESGGFGKA
jgi:hypothetical protein